MSAATENIFTREAFVAALTDYYEFIKKVYMPDHMFKYPPPGGWPQLDRDSLSFMGKSDLVLDTLQNMPYIEWPHCGPHEIYHGCAAIDYTSAGFKKECIDKAANGDEPDRTMYDELIGFDECTFSSDVFWLAGSCKGRSGFTMVVDTSRNTITLLEHEGNPEPTDLSEWGYEEDDPEGKGQEWKEYQTWTVKGFFQHLKDLFQSFILLPKRCSERDLELTDHGHAKPWSPAAITLLQQHGWLSEGFDKDVCLPKLYKLIKDVEEPYYK